MTVQGDIVMERSGYNCDDPIEMQWRRRAYEQDQRNKKRALAWIQLDKKLFYWLREKAEDNAADNATVNQELQSSIPVSQPAPASAALPDIRHSIPLSYNAVRSVRSSVGSFYAGAQIHVHLDKSPARLDTDA